MASKSMKNVISVLALSNGIALVVKNSTQAKTPTQYANKLDEACTSAFQLWPGSLEKRELSSIYSRLAAFEQQNIPEQGRPEFLTSIALGLIDGLEQVIKDPIKRTALERVGKALCQVHGYYDRRWDKFEIYEAAGRCIEQWDNGCGIGEKPR
jgi:hypothetical protein